MRSILITGGTGTLGSNLIFPLYERGFQIFCLIRPQKDVDINSRLWQTLGRKLSNIRTIAGDITIPMAGVKKKDLSLLLNHNIDIVFHSAASIRFDVSKSEEIKRVNVFGTKNIISLAKKIKAKFFHHVSTAYVAGDADKFSEDDVEIGQHLRNPYEKTKKEAEEIVRSTYGRNKLFTIYRPSIIIGDSKTGRIGSFDGLYGYLKSFWRLKTMVELMNIFQRKKVKKICHLVGDGELKFDINIHCSRGSRINLVPIDWVVETILNLIDHPTDGITYHLVHDDPPEAGWVFRQALEFINIYGVSLDEAKEGTKLPPPFDFLNRVIDIYSPYLLHETKFEISNLKKVLGVKYKAPPLIDRNFLERIVKFAVDKNFGNLIPR